jgi:hypothetical protein
MILESDYPAALKGALEQAAGLSRRLAAPDLAARLGLWAIGRSEEIARFVELVVGDWRCGALSERAATAELESYVRTLEGALHEQLAAGHFSRGDALPLSRTAELRTNRGRATR